MILRWKALLFIGLVLAWTQVLPIGSQVATCSSRHVVSRATQLAATRAVPKLRGLIGRRAGSVPDYDGYSDVMKSSSVVWTEDSLDRYLADPAGFMPGNGMAGAAGDLKGPDSAA